MIAYRQWCTDMYRTLIYENSIGQKLYLTKDANSFLYDLQNMGFSYTNEISTSEYDTWMQLERTDISRSDLSGTYLISYDSNSDIYTAKNAAEKILNYDQVLNRTRKNKVHGKLYYSNASARTVYAYALLKGFEFGEIEENEENQLAIKISFSLLTKNWISIYPKTFSMELLDTDFLGHPFSHPFGHVSDAEQNNQTLIFEVSGNDVAYIVIRVYGAVTNPSLSIWNFSNPDEKYTIKYLGTVQEGSVLEINMIDMYTTVDGVNAIADFDIVNYSIPFFNLVPGKYVMNMQSDLNRGKIQIDIYDSWVSG